MAERSTKVEELLALAESLDDDWTRFQGHVIASKLAAEQGAGPALRRHTEEAERRARLLREPRWTWVVRIRRVAVDLLDGDLEAMLARADEALALGQSCDQPEAFGTWLGHQSEALVRLDRAAEAHERLVAPLLVEGWEHAEGVVNGPNLALLAAPVLTAMGRRDEVAEVLDRAGLRVEDVVRTNLPWSSHLILWSRASAFLGRTADLRAIADALTPLAGQVAVSPPGMPFGAVDLALGHIASALGDHAAADRHFAAAQALHERLESPTFLAEGWLAWGETALAAGDAEAARSRLEQAVDLATAHDLRRDLRLAREALATIG